MKAFSWQRLLAIFIKEFQQMLRDRLTFAMAIGVPIMQLILFGYAINTDPKGLPTAVVSADAGPLSRSLSAALQNTGYFKVIHVGTSEREAEALIEDGDAQFMVVIPNDFTHRVLRGEKPAVLVSVDATASYRALNINEQIKNNKANLVLSDKNLEEITKIVEKLRTSIVD